MKTFRLMGMAMAAIMMCVNFAACSSESDESDEIIKDGDGVITSGKKLVEVKRTSTDRERVYVDAYTFLYDSKGKLTTIVNSEATYDDKSDDINITWSENAVKESSNNESITYSLKDGLIVSALESGDQKYSFTYNSFKQLATGQSQYQADKVSKKTFTWENDVVTKIDYDNGEISEITYSNQTCKGYFPLMSLEAEDEFMITLAHPELIGMRVTQLPTQLYRKEVQKGESYSEFFKETCKYETIDERTYKYTYTLTNDGYVESATVVNTNLEIRKRSFEDKNGDNLISDSERNVVDTETNTYTSTYTFKWK